MDCNNCQLYSFVYSKFENQRDTKTYAVTRTKDTVDVTCSEDTIRSLFPSNEHNDDICGFFRHFHLNFICRTEYVM